MQVLIIPRKDAGSAGVGSEVNHGLLPWSSALPCLGQVYGEGEGGGGGHCLRVHGVQISLLNVQLSELIEEIGLCDLTIRGQDLGDTVSTLMILFYLNDFPVFFDVRK